MKLSKELDYRIRYDVEHDLFHVENIFNDEYITPTFIEYVQKLETENAELKEKLFTAKNERNAFKIYSDGAEADAIKLNEQLSEAKEIIQKLQICLEGHHTNSFEYEQIKQAETFLSEVEK